jgi:hypothetical protein
MDDESTTAIDQSKPVPVNEDLPPIEFDLLPKMADLGTPHVEEGAPAKEPIHIKRFDVADVPEVWARDNLAGRRCTACRSPQAVLQMLVWMPVEDLMRKRPDVARMLALANEGTLPVTPLIDGGKRRDFICVSDTVACARCRQVLERTAARNVPSWCVVERREAPKHAVVVPVSGFRNRRS